MALGGWLSGRGSLLAAAICNVLLQRAAGLRGAADQAAAAPWCLAVRFLWLLPRVGPARMGAPIVWWRGSGLT